MDSAEAYRASDPEPQRRVVYSSDDTLMASPRFARTVGFMVLLSLPLWALIIGSVYAVVRLVA